MTWSLRSRMLVLFAVLILLSVAGTLLLLQSQERINQSTRKMRDHLLPAARIVELVKSEIDLQAQEINARLRSTGKTKPTPQELALLRLGPNTRALRSMMEGPLLPDAVRPLIVPWGEAVDRYQERVTQVDGWVDALNLLQDLKARTELVRRAVDREFSVQLLGVSRVTREHVALWGISLGATLLLAGIFLFLLWRWMRPLHHMRAWLDSHASSHPQMLAPRSEQGSGWLAAPNEVQVLAESLRRHVQASRELATESEARAARASEIERAMGTLFLALQNFARNNEELLQELLRRERLASMGEMAATLAHEIRNPLNSMNLKLELLRDELPPAQAKQLDSLLGEIDRLDALTESHLRLTRSRLSEENPFESEAACDLSSLVRGTLEYLQPELAQQHLRVECELPAKLTVQAPSNVLRAALINLIKNAREAMQTRGAGRLRIEAQLKNNHWSLRVLDEGVGFAPEYMNTPIEKFRSSKIGGTGLGLASSQSMLAAYGIRLAILPPSGKWKACVELSGALTNEDVSLPMEASIQ